MRLLDQARAITRLVLFKSEEGTISEQAQHAAEMARLERERAKQDMDNLLSALVRQRIEKGVTSSESIGNGIHK